MLLVGYLYGIKSERRLVQEIQLNVAYRWFCGFELDEKTPDHSTFSKTRQRKWTESNLFRNVFVEIVRLCIETNLVDGKEMVSDGSSFQQKYPGEELSAQPGFKNPPARTVISKRTTSTTDQESGYINHGSKRGIGYLMEETVDCKHGIVTGVDVYPPMKKKAC